MQSKRLLEHWQVITAYMIVYDLVAIAASFFIALWLRYDCRYAMIPPEYLNLYIRSIPFYCVICVLLFMAIKLYRSIWRFASYVELGRTVIATLAAVLLHWVLLLFFEGNMPVSYFIFGTVIQFCATIGVRFSYRFIILLRGRRDKSEDSIKRILLVGAGDAGQMILRDIKHTDKTSERVTCIIDDNPNKWGRYIDGIPVVPGGREKIAETVNRYSIDKIYVAIPSASADDKKEILKVCSETGCELMALPGMYQLYTGQLSVSNLKRVNVEDLLGREPIKVNTDEILEALSGKRIIVTGGGGSIGSELCRQIAAHNPAMLIIFDIYENNAYDIQQELRRSYPDLNLKVIIGSVRDSRKLFQVFEKFKPEVVYHAAAHKHVPLMEDSPCEAIKNNAIGTYKTAYAAMANGCDRFVLISTDKAVNPTNIMGASKRLCEMIIQSFDKMVKEGRAAEMPELYTHREYVPEVDPEMLRNAKTDFVAVRFGNVLGSNGSVIPLFKKQIAEGGPVTVTHPDIIRYFMTIPEAVSLVLQAGTYAKGGEIFVLDMGEPVKIDTLARNLIRLSGHKPDEDIKIVYTGLRPGEKLFEEKLMSEEGLKKTDNKLIFIGSPIPFDIEDFLKGLNDLMVAAYNNRPNIRQMVADMVSTYHPADI